MVPARASIPTAPSAPLRTHTSTRPSFYRALIKPIIVLESNTSTLGPGARLRLTRALRTASLAVAFQVTNRLYVKRLVRAVGRPTERNTAWLTSDPMDEGAIDT